MAVLLLAGGLVGFGLMPGQAFVPLLPEDFPAWQVGRAPEELAGHPHPNYTMSDVLHLLVPGLQTTRRALDDGRLPLWDPSQALGLPHLAQVHYGVFYPPTWLFHALGVRGLGFMAFVHLALAGLGMLLYVRALGRSSVAGMVAALAFAGCAWVTARLHAFPLVGAAIWAPWILWGLERAHQGHGPRFRVAAAVALALSIFAGHPQTTAWVVVMVVYLEVVRALVALRAREPALRPALGAVLTLLGGVLLATPQLVPTLAYLRGESLRATVTADAVVAERLEPPLLWHLLTPDRYADASLPPVPPHPLALRDLDQAQRPSAANRAEVSMSVGVVPLALAVIAILLGRGWRARAYALLVLGVFAVLAYEPLLRPLAETVPLLRYGNPKRLLLVTSFGLCVLAAAGVDMVRRPRLSVAVTGWIVAVATTILAVVARVTVPRTDESALRAWADAIVERVPVATGRQQVFEMIPETLFEHVADVAASSANLAIVMGALAVVMLRPRRHHTEQGWRLLAQRLPGVLPLLVVVELWMSGFPLLRSAPVDEDGWLDPASGLPRTPPLAQTAQLVETGPSQPVRLARYGVGAPYLRPNFPSLFALQDVQCYAPMAPARSVELLRAIEPTLTADGSSIHGFTRPGSLAAPMLDLLGVSVVLTEDAALETEGYREVATHGPVRVLANEQARPRAVLVDGREVVPDAEARLARLGESGFDPFETILLAREPRSPARIPEAEVASATGAGGPGADGEGEEADTGADTGSDVASIADPDVGADAARTDADTDPDAAADTASDTNPDTGQDTDPDTDADTASDAGQDTAPDTGSDTDADAGPAASGGPARASGDERAPREPGVEILGTQPAAAGRERELVMTSYEPGRMRILVGPGPATHLVVAETWAPGWSATVNGETVDVLAADHALIGLDLPWPEPLDIVLHYEAAATRRALWIGGLLWLAALGLLAWPARRAAR